MWCISIVCSTRFLNGILLVVILSVAVLSVVVKMKISRVNSEFILDGQYLLKMLIVSPQCCMVQEATILLSRVLLFLLIMMFMEIVFFLKLEDTRDSHFSIGGLSKADRGLGSSLFGMIGLVGGIRCRSAFDISLMSACICSLQSICKLCINCLSTKK